MSDSNDVALQWGLPAGFRPVMTPIDDDVKNAVRGVLRPNEPVIATLQNEEGALSLVATSQRVFVVKSGAMAGVGGMQLREYPWEGISDLKLQSNPTNVKISLTFHTRDGKTAEVGPRAHQWKTKSDDITPIETDIGMRVFEALQTVWHHRRSAAAS